MDTDCESGALLPQGVSKTYPFSDRAKDEIEWGLLCSHSSVSLPLAPGEPPGQGAEACGDKLLAFLISNWSDPVNQSCRICIPFLALTDFLCSPFYCGKFQTLQKVE